ncbi:MAG TPA: type II secretion system F family protein [Steroidobacteraceae bacterium]|nr:type II secretion system F family protein [Steroidobacteraceae bacterium]
MLSWPLLLVLAGGALALPGLRGLREIRGALRAGELARLSAPPHWPATRALLGLVAAIPVWLATASLGTGALGAALVAAALGYAAAPQFLASLRRRAEQALLDELALHLDLIALAVESGSSLLAALNACATHAPDGPLRRAWARIVLEVHAGAELPEALRDLDLRMGLRGFSTALMALRSAERTGIDAGPILRERARQLAAGRFARAERLARAAPLKLWATLMLCLAPCTLLVLAFPVAHLLALLFER